MRERNLVVLSAGLSHQSSTPPLADQLAAATGHALAESPRVEVFALCHYAKDVANYLATGIPSDELRAVLDQLATADGVIAVTPIFQTSPGGLFKWFFDAVGTDALAGKPVLMGATGGSPDHALALEHVMLPMFGDLRAVVVPTTVYAASEDRDSAGEGTAPAHLVERAAGEFAALVDHCPAPARPDASDETVHFGQLHTYNKRTRATAPARPRTRRRPSESFEVRPSPRAVGHATRSKAARGSCC